MHVRPLHPANEHKKLYENISENIKEKKLKSHVNEYLRLWIKASQSLKLVHHSVGENYKFFSSVKPSAIKINLQ